MAVRDQNPLQPFESQTRLQNLALRAFPAINQEAILVVHHNLRRQAAMHGGRGSGCAKEGDFKQGEPLRVKAVCSSSAILPLSNGPIAPPACKRGSSPL
jgi:hypothetical protein